MEDKGKKMINSLKKPAQFKKTSEVNLKSPLNFSNHTLSEMRLDVKKPCDFVLTGNVRSIPKTQMHSTEGATVTEKSEEVKVKKFEQNKLESVQHSRHIDIKLPSYFLGKTESRVFPDKDVIDNNRNNINMIPGMRCAALIESTSPEKDDVQIELHYLQALKKIQELEAIIKEKDKLIEKKNIEVQIKKATTESNKIHAMEESNALKNENKSLKEKLEHLDRAHFSEVKSVYDKYIMLQNQLESEKTTLNNIIIGLKRNISELSEEKRHFADCLKQVEMKRNEKEKIVQERFEAYEKDIKDLNANMLKVTQRKENFKHEKEDYWMKLENSLNTVSQLNHDLENKDSTICELRKKSSEEEQKQNKSSNHYEHEINSFKVRIENNEKKLKEEVIRNMNLEGTVKQKQSQIFNLEKALSQMRSYVDEVDFSVEKQMHLQQEEIALLQQTCKTLESTNEFLNVRLRSVNEVLHMQELSTKGIVNGAKYDELLKMWREKVYSLLVLLKTQELKDTSARHPHDKEAASEASI